MAVLPFKARPCSTLYLTQHILSSTPPYVFILLLLMLPPIFQVTEMRKVQALFRDKSSCCSFPCRNGGVCVESCNDYTCDCTGTHHYGKNCQHEILMRKILRNNQALWHTLYSALGLKKVVDYFDFLHSFFYGKRIKAIVRNVREPTLSSIHGGICNNIFNSCSEALLLSTVPSYCPTPLGITGFHILPPLESLFELVLKRCGPFQPSKGKANLLFVAYGQFLAKQMSCSNNVNWLGSSGMYGNFERTHCHGKISRSGTARRECCHMPPRDVYHTSMMSDAIQNIILMEHNRVCDLLFNAHPGWSDQKLYETAILVVTGEVITITSTEWLPYLKQYDIKLKYKSPYTSIILNKVPYEVILAFFWPQMYPDVMSIGGSNIDLEVLSNGGTESLRRGGTFQLMNTLAATCPGRMGPQNVPAVLEEKTKRLILEGRKRNLQSFNNYRVLLGLERCRSFEELTGDPTVQTNLQKMYGNIEGLEFIPGLLLETPKNGKVLGDTMTELISDLVFKAVVTHPLTTNAYFKKSTFGGNQGWDIVKNSNIKNLICQNVNEGCSEDVVLSFGKKKCQEEPKCARKAQDNVHKPVPKKICGAPDLPTAQSFTEEKPEVVVTESPESPKMCNIIVKPTVAVQKQHCPFSKPSRPSHKPEHKSVAHNHEETCKKAPTPEVRHPPPAKRCCIRRPWFRTRNIIQ